MPLLNMKKCAENILITIFVLVSTLGIIKGGAWAAITLVGAALLVWTLWMEQKQFPWPDKKIALYVVAFLAAAGGLALVSPFEGKALYSTLKLATIFVPLVFFSSSHFLKTGDILWEKRDTMADILATGFVVIIVMLVVTSYFYGYESLPITKLNRGLSYGILLAGPLLAVTLGDSKKQGLLLLGTMAVALLLTHSRTTQAAAFVAVIVFALARVWPVVTARLLALGVGLSVLWPFGATWLFQAHRDLVFKLPPTLVARVEIWDYFAHRIAENPLLGYGLGVSSRLDWLSPNGDLYKYTVGQAAHPHNAIVQLWAEMGVLGLLFGFIAFFGVLFSIQKLKSSHIPYALATFAAGFTLLMAAYNLWTDSLLAALVLTIYLFACFSNKKLKLP